MENARVAIVIPAYNEEKSITEVVQSVRDLAEIIVVSDNSRDKTSEAAKSAGAKVVELRENLGYEGAIEAGLEFASKCGFEYVLTMDADGQHTRNAMKCVLDELLLKKVDLVIGIRPGFARLGEQIFCKYFSVRFGVKDALCGLKGYRLEWFKALGYFDRSKLVGSELMMFIIKQGGSFTQVPIELRDRTDESRYGTSFKANLKILKALRAAVRIDALGNAGFN